VYRISGNSDSACGRVHGDIRDWDNSDSAAKFHEAFIVVAILVIAIARDGAKNPPIRTTTIDTSNLFFMTTPPCVFFCSP